jgi:cellulose synthase (UDP-forming)
MYVQAASNPATGNRWRGVYTPDVLAVGEGPTSWEDYFNQQKRWSYGIWEILLTAKRDVRRRLTGRQRLLYGCVQFYYPSVAAGLLLGNLATALYLLFGIASVSLHSLTWLALWSASLASWFLLWFWLRRFNLAEHERVEVGMPGMALALFAGPVYLAAAVAALLRRPLAYTVTAKGKLRTTESMATFRLHLWWAAVAAGLLAASLVRHHDYLALRAWSVLTLFTGLGPPILAGISGLVARRRARSAQVEAGTVRGSAAVPAACAARIPSQRVSNSPAAHNQEWHGEPQVWRDQFELTTGQIPDRRAVDGKVLLAHHRPPAIGIARVPHQLDRRPAEPTAVPPQSGEDR